jgi:hypothetical protein
MAPLEDVVPNHEDREDAFERLEVLLSAFSTHEDHEPVAGRYLWRGGGYLDGGIAQVMKREATDLGEDWPPIAAGLTPSVEAFVDAISKSVAFYSAIRRY